MSIQDKITNLCNNKCLFRLVPEYQIERERRTMYVSPDIHSLVCGPIWTSEEQEFRWQSVRADLDWFVQAKTILVPIDSQHGGNAHMSQLKPPDTEVWDFRCRDPEPGIRILGSFAEKDAFVALTWELRNPLGAFGSREWDAAILRCKTNWLSLFECQPLTGSYPSDYISNAISIGDD
jgi:hypothetical protein